MRASTSLLESKVQSHAAVGEGLLNSTTCTDCCSVAEDLFLPGNDLENVSNVSSSASCCAHCRNHKTCLAWTWGKQPGKPWNEVCFLKGAQPRPLTKVSAPGFVSGFTNQLHKLGAP